MDYGTLVIPKLFFSAFRCILVADGVGALRMEGLNDHLRKADKGWPTRS